MLLPFTYPVSGIMKVWHLIIDPFLTEGVAWLICIPLLVVTVRGLILPLNWMSIRSGRIGALMRPEMYDLRDRMKAVKDPAEMLALQKEQRALHERYGYKPSVGCIPPLIMIPVFLGLYRVILHMARPDQDASIGLLTPEEVLSFRSTTFQGIPLPAYVSMPDDVAASLGVSGADVKNVITPWLIAAILFTVANLGISLYRGFLTTQFDEKLARRLFYFLIFMTVAVPFLLWNAAMNAPVPTAIIVYWACTNLFTLCQTIVFEFILRKRYALGDAHHALRRESWAAFRAGSAKLTKEEKAQRKLERKRRGQLIAQARMLARKEAEAKQSPEEPA
ncbi:Membrane protein insertase MisCB precursor [Corynebacterium endometrii]|uniref:Membrane protein insertase YidC n=2 Tax=Corynebacterium endometrii TaxID=2488819 RepID=A0A4P7QIA5_9CORY|nr:Membrane protein insertase MisCB precursor [Corynebacterium endometrii]